MDKFPHFLRPTSAGLPKRVHGTERGMRGLFALATTLPAF